jgi:hypothetical protein
MAKEFDDAIKIRWKTWNGGEIMEAIGIGIEAIGNAIGAIVMWPCLVQVAGIGAAAFLIYTDKIKVEDVKNFIIKKENSQRKR